ncbi:MAG: GNAT family N-acetyltransferase [Chloroflexi bacterium]|nr:MAG: GNAT family N-acetyltransferase [Chloroflexota bacterium]
MHAPLVAAAMGPDGDLVTERLARGVRCFVVRIEDALAGYGWLSTGPEWIGEIQLELRPRQREGYIWNCVTAPEHRQKGVFGSLVLGIASAARRTGLRRVWIGTVAVPAEKALEPAGFRPALHFDVSALAGMRLMRVRRSADTALATDASSALRVRAGLVIRGSHPRRH